MTPDHRAVLDACLRLHAHKAPLTEGAHVAYLARKETAAASHGELLAWEADDILGELDAESYPVRCLLAQMRDLDTRRHRIVGVIFDRATVFYEVLRAPPPARRA